MKDVTSVLLGDPSSVFRREPTQKEMMDGTRASVLDRPQRTGKRRDGTKISMIWSMNVGDGKFCDTKNKAYYLHHRLTKEGFGAETVRCPGGFYVKRIS